MEAAQIREARKRKILERSKGLKPHESSKLYIANIKNV